MTQEWFESADLEKKSPQTKSEIQPDEPETSETVETEPQASEETSVPPKELERHEEEAPETIEEAQTEEEGEEKAEEEHKQENPTKEKSILSKALESPYIPDIDPRKTARFKEEISLFWSWLLDAIQEPTTSKTTDQRHRYSVFGLLTLLSSINLFFSIYHIIIQPVIIKFFYGIRIRDKLLPADLNECFISGKLGSFPGGKATALLFRTADNPPWLVK